MQVEAALFSLPLIVSIIYREPHFWAFIVSAAISLAIGFALTLLSRPQKKNLFVKEGFVIVALSWTLMSVVGCLPFFISGEIPNFVNALFETVSGFTTTGASVLTEPGMAVTVETLSRGMLFWRSFTHFIGGMGVLVLVMAILPIEGSKSIHLMRAEMPGPIVGKLVPKAKSTALILYIIYVAMTAIEAILLLFGGMSVFESLCLAFGTAGTGGFAPLMSSINSYSSYIQWVITAFMFLFGVNFNLYYLILVGKIGQVIKSRELWCYCGIVVASVSIICANIFNTCNGFGDALRTSAFNVASYMSSTGYGTVATNEWPYLSKAILVILMFVGACAGSTGGGLKVSRVMMLFKIMRRDLKKTLHPRQVSLLTFEGKKVDDQTISNVSSYFLVYLVIFAAVCFALTLEPMFDFGAAFTATLSCLNNIGPFFSATASVASYANFSIFAKILLTVTMLFGRLEIYPMLFALSPSTWMEK